MNNSKDENQIFSQINLLKSANSSQWLPFDNKPIFKKNQILNTISSSPKIPLYTFRKTIQMCSTANFSNKDLGSDYQRILALKNRSLLNVLVFLFSLFAIINCILPLIYSEAKGKATSESIIFLMCVCVAVLLTNCVIFLLMRKFIYQVGNFKRWLVYQNYAAIFFCFFCTLGEIAVLGLIPRNEWLNNNRDSKTGYFWGYLLYPFLFISFLKLLNNLLMKIIVLWITQSIISVFLLFLDQGLVFYDYITLYAYSIIYFLFCTIIIYISEFEAKETLEFFANFQKTGYDWQKITDMIPHCVLLFRASSNNELLFCNDYGNKLFEMRLAKSENRIDYLSNYLGPLRKIKVSSQNISDDLEEMLKLNENNTDKPMLTKIHPQGDKTLVLPEFCTLKEILNRANDYSHLYSEKDTIIYATKSKVHINQRFVDLNESNERNFSVKIKFITFESKLSVLLILEDCTYVEIISELHESSKFKSKLLSSFSHELKTPLNGAIPILESLENEGQLDLPLLRVSIASLKILQTALDDIIDYALINSGDFQLNCTEINLNELMNDLMYVLSIQSKEKSITVSLIQDPNIPKTFFTDYKRLRQILMNVLRNSVKFSLNKGHITIKIMMDQFSSILNFVIEDLGIGIEPKKLQNLQNLLLDLKAHEKMNNHCDEEFNLGLVISQNLALILGPSNATQGIQIYSDGIEKGTRVEFRIEDKMNFSLSAGEFSSIKMVKSQIKSSKILAAKVVCRKNHHLPTKKMTWIHKLEMIEFPDKICEESKSIEGIELEEKDSFINSETKETHEVTNLVKQFNFKINTLTQIALKQSILCCEPILVVDDDPFNLLSAEVILKKIGFKIQKAFNGMEAIEKVAEKFKNKCSHSCQGFRLILMDYNMPVMNGIEATKKLTEMMNAGEINKIPIVACTAFGAKEDLINCFEAGMVDYISKPIQSAIVEKVIKKWLK